MNMGRGHSLGTELTQGLDILLRNQGCQCIYSGSLNTEQTHLTDIIRKLSLVGEEVLCIVPVLQSREHMEAVQL